MNNDCNHNKCQCNSDKCGISLKTIPAALGDDTGEFKPENGAYCNTFVKYEANGAQYFYSKDGIFSKVAEIPGYVKQQSDFAETNEESPAFIKNKELVATAEQLEAEATARAEQDEFLHNENVSLGNELNAEKNARIQKDTQLDNAINTKAAKVDLQTEISARQSAVQAEATARQNAIQAEATARQNADKALSDRMDAFSGMDYVVVEQLPTVGEKGKVYLVPKEGEHPDVHDEFIWVNGQWELIGSTQMDLTDYVKNTDYSTATKAGVVRDANCFLTSDVNGGAYAETMSFNSYNVASGYNFIGKGTLENVLNGRKYLMPEYTLELPTTGEANKLYLTPATEQPDVEATASGKDIELADASEGDLIDWTIKGDTEQASYTGKNLFDFNSWIEASTTRAGVTWSVSDNETIVSSGTSTDSYTACFYQFTESGTGVPTGMSEGVYYAKLLSDNPNLQLYGLCRRSGSSETVILLPRTDANTKVSFSIDSTTTSVRFRIIAKNTGLDCSGASKIILSSDESFVNAGVFEPYVGGTPSPSPDYPQEVKTVTGRQTVSVVGKNVFDGEIEFGQLNISTGEKSTPTSDRYRTVNFVPILPNTTYSYSSSLGAERWSCYYDENKVFISSFHMITSTSGKTATFTTPVNARYIKWYTIGGATEYTQQLEKGSVASTFQPYSGQEVEINLGKNLVDVNNATIYKCYLGSASIRMSDNGNSLLIPVNAGETYTISRQDATGTVPAIGFINDIPREGLAWSDRHEFTSGELSYTAVAPSGYKYMLLYFAWSTESEATQRAYLLQKQFQIERGDKATEYAPYFEPIELCKLGDYQDRIFKDGDTWKIEKHVGKSTFNGSEDWFKSGASTEDIFVGALNIYNLGFRLPYEASYRHNIVSNLGKQTSDTVVGGIDIYNQTSGFFAYVRTSGTTTYASDIATFKEKLAENNMQFYYLLTEPQVIEITYQPLIDQLNELETLTTVKGYNRITTDTPSVQPFLEFGYFRPDPTVTKDEWLWVENHYEQIGSHRWGSLTGNISDQQDLKHELDSIKDSVKSKVDKSDNSLVRSDEATKLKVLTQAQYDALTPAADTIYFIKEA